MKSLLGNQHYRDVAAQIDSQHLACSGSIWQSGSCQDNHAVRTTIPHHVRQLGHGSWIMDHVMDHGSCQAPSRVYAKLPSTSVMRWLMKLGRATSSIHCNSRSPDLPVQEIGCQRRGIAQPHLHDVGATLEQAVRGVIVHVSISPEREEILDHS